MAAFHTSSFSSRLTVRTLPSAIRMLASSSSPRKPDRPPTPPQLTSGLSSLIRARAGEGALQEAAVHPAGAAVGGDVLVVLPVLDAGVVLDALQVVLLQQDCWRCTVVALTPPSPLSVSPAIIVLLVPSVMSVSFTFEFW